MSVHCDVSMYVTNIVPCLDNDGQVFGLEAKEIIRGKTKSIVLINTLPPETRELGLIKRYNNSISMQTLTCMRYVCETFL